MSDKTLDVSIVLAVYNEEQSVQREMEIIKNAMTESKFSYEIIAVNDASTDNTARILKDIKGIKLITHRINKGSGGARKTGTFASSGRIIVWSDVDMTYPNHLIPELIGRLECGGFRQIVGSRLKEKGSLKAFRAPAKYVLRRLASFLTKTEIPDLNSGFRAFYREDGMKMMYMVPNGFSCVSTMTLSFLCNGRDVGYMPIEYKARQGKSKFHPIKDSYNYLLQIIRMVTYFEPLRIFVPAALLIFCVTLTKHIVDIIVTRNTQETDIIGYFMAFIIFAVGLLADLIVTQNKRFMLPASEYKQTEAD